MTDKQIDFQREERYIVVKLKRIDDATERVLRKFLQSWQIPTEPGVFIENDWPIYEPVWEMVRQLACGEWQAAKQQPKAVPDGYTPVRTEVLQWLLGEAGDFEPPKWQRDEHERIYGRLGSYWWRTHLRRAMLEHPGASTTAVDDQDFLS